MIRARIEATREVRPKSIIFGGPLPFIKCVCGKWKVAETGSHDVQVVSVSEMFGKEVCEEQEE